MSGAPAQTELAACMPGRVEQIQARVDTVTPGPWWYFGGQEREVYAGSGSGDDIMVGADFRLEADADLFVNAAADLAWLLAERAKLLDELSEYRATIRDVEAIHAKGDRPDSQHYYCDPDECDRAGEGELVAVCDHDRETWPCETIRSIRTNLGDKPNE